MTFKAGDIALVLSDYDNQLRHLTVTKTFTADDGAQVCEITTECGPQLIYAGDLMKPAARFVAHKTAVYDTEGKADAFLVARCKNADAARLVAKALNDNPWALDPPPQREPLAREPEKFDNRPAGRWTR